MSAITHMDPFDDLDLAEVPVPDLSDVPNPFDFDDLDLCGYVPEEAPAEPDPSFVDLHCDAQDPVPDHHSEPVQTRKPYQRDPSYRVMEEARDILLQVARKDKFDDLKVKSAIGAAKVASEMVSLFGVDMPEADNVNEAAVLAAGREAARRAVNQGMFGPGGAAQPQPWLTPIGHTNPQRKPG